MNTQEWNRLVSGLIEGSLTPHEQERLKAICRQDPAREEELVRAMLTERLLPLAVAPDLGDHTAGEVMARVENRILDFPEPPARTMKRRNPRRAILIGAAAALAISTGSWLWRDAAKPTGYLTRSESLTWNGSPAGLPEGGLFRGQRLRAASGLAEIEMRNGARLVLEGPFDLELTGYKTVTLHSGRLAARCPPSARGFTILTPRGEVVDLGTELGVSVEDDGAVEAHVLTGSVEVAGPATGRRISLFDGEAVRMDSAATRRVMADPSAFVTTMPLPEDLPTGFVHWSMDENQGPSAADSGQGLAGGTDATLALGADTTTNTDATPPGWTEGVRGSALAFDGRGSFAESTYRGIEGALPRTVALWIRTADPDVHSGTGILSWGTVLEDSAWQISLNWSEVDGPVGRLRLGNFGGKIVGTTNLRDGRWHHVAVVMHPPFHPDATANVLLYVDGNLEPIAKRSNFRVNTNTRQAEHGVSLGRHVSFINETRMFFHGEMDEVFIFGRPLVRDQIQQLMKGGSGTFLVK